MAAQEKKPYCKPEMEQVKLVAEEAVLGGCKTASGGGVGTIQPVGNCATDSCVSSNVLS